MSLTIYRRHSIDCKVHKLKLSERAKRFYTDCECRIWLTGTTDSERYPRQSTGITDWTAAEAYLASLVAGAKDTAVHGPTLSDCISRHLDAHGKTIGPRTLQHHKLTLTRLEDFAKSRNKLFMSELTVDLLEDFKTYALAKFKSTTQALAVSKLKVFLSEAYRRGWTTEALALKVKSTKAVYEQAMPYTDQEVGSILDHASALNGSKHGYASQGETFALLLEFMLETGLRVSDGIRYNPKHCKKSSHLWMYTFQPVKQRKNEKPKQHEVFLTDRLKLAIDEAVWFSKTHPFAYRAFGVDTVQEYAVYERMQTIGERAGIEDCRPHRLRDTCAMRLLVRGMSLEDVSQLLGHSSIAVTQKHYAPWVPSRRLRLEGLLSQALVDPRGN